MEKRETVSTAELARILNVTPKTIAAWLQAGIVAKVSHGKYGVRATLESYALHMQQRERGAIGALGSKLYGA